MPYRPHNRTTYEEAFALLSKRKWTRASNYAGPDWHNYALVVSCHRGSDLLEQCNLEAATSFLEPFTTKDASDETLALFYAECDNKDEMKDLKEELRAAVVVTNNHWAVGWVKYLMVDLGDRDAVLAAGAILQDLDDYPILDENAYIEAEDKAIDECWKSMRQTERVYILKRAYFSEQDAQRYAALDTIEQVLDESADDTGNIWEQMREYIRG